MKVILIQGLLAPYRYPIFEELSKTIHGDFEVWFMGKRVKNRIWNEDGLAGFHFRHRFLPGITVQLGRKDMNPFWINTTILSDLSASRPDAVIMMGWDSLSSFLVHAYCKIFGIKYILFADSTPLELSWRRTITKSLVSLHVSSSDSVIAGGTLSKNYLLSLGAKRESLYVSYNTVDVQKYQSNVALAKLRSAQTKLDLRIKTTKIILYYGQLIERKGVDLLISAFKQIKSQDPDVSLLIIGDGANEANLKSMAKSLSLTDIFFLSNPGDDEIYKYYAIADVFVLPSREDVWGLVANEAMAAGIPLVVSDKSGCAIDLSRDGQTGYTFHSGDISDLAAKILMILSDDKLRHQMSLSVTRRINQFKPQITTKKFFIAITQRLLNRHNKIAFFFDSVPGLISIIIPVYQDEAGLRKTLDSLANQTGNVKYEIIVEHDTIGGHSYATRNKAISRSKGEYLAFIDAGTIATPNWLVAGLKDLTIHDYVGGAIGRSGMDDHLITRAVKRFSDTCEFDTNMFFNKYHFSPTTNLFIKRRIMGKVGGFDERLISSGDLEFGNRVYESGLYSMHLDQDLLTSHPYRSLVGLIKKQIRIAKGSLDLGRYYPARFKWLKFSLPKTILLLLVPPIWLLSQKNFKEQNLMAKIQIFMISYVLNITHRLATIRYGLFRAR